MSVKIMLAATLLAALAGAALGALLALEGGPAQMNRPELWEPHF